MTGLLLSLIGGTFRDWVSTRSEIAKAQAVARAESVKNGIPGWSDELLVLVWSWPFVACYLPGGGEYSAQALGAIDALPGWYVQGFYIVTGAVFGLDKFLKWKR